MQFDTISLPLSILANGLLAATYIKTQVEIKRLSYDVTFGIYKREYIERRAPKANSKEAAKKSLIFLDINDMHALNEKLGYAEVDSRINKALRVTRRNELIGRWYSGDELVIICDTVSVDCVIRRLTESFSKYGITFESAATPYVNLKSSVEIASKTVQQIKLSKKTSC